MLTPIKIRGKNKRDQTKRSRSSTPSALSRPSSVDSSRSTSSRPAKRRKVVAKGTDQDGLAKGRKLSRLESLPMEILEMILFDSMNVSLPLASPFIGKRLSNRHVYTTLCLKAFNLGGDDHGGYDAEVQSAILSRRWATLDLFEALWQMCPTCEKCVVDHCEGIVADEGGKYWGFYGWSEDVIEYARSYITSPQRGKPKFRGPIWRELICKAQSKHSHCMPGCRLPIKVLRADLDPDRIRFGQQLIAWGASVDWENSTDGELAEQHLRKLLTLDAEPLAINAAVRLMMDKAVGIRTDTELIRLAISHQKGFPPLLKTLWRYGHPTNTDIDWHDKALWAAAGQAAEESENGEWLFAWLRKEGVHRFFERGSTSGMG